jgi:Spondin_N
LIVAGIISIRIEIGAKGMKKKIIGLVAIVTVVIAGFGGYFIYKNSLDKYTIVGDAGYEVTFTSTWSEKTHSYKFPSNPHFSGLIGATHNSSITFWKEDILASPGIKNMSEFGSKDPLNNEIDLAINSSLAFSKLSGGGLNPSPGDISLKFNVSKDFPLVTLVIMLAPSPDWFLGVKNLNLYENGAWVTEKTVSLYLYDAGTDSGKEFTSQNNVTIPATNITKILPSQLPGSDIAFGTFTFKKLK